MRGRAAIARGDVEAREWWGDVRLDVDKLAVPATLDQASIHWFWVRDSPVIYGKWKSNGETPERVLFYELRPDEWDATSQPRRLTLVCGVDDCINPWHFDIGTAVGRKSIKSDPVERELVKSRAALEEQATTAQTYNAVTLYIELLEDDVSWEALVTPDGKLKTALAAKWAETSQGVDEPVAIALLANWLESEEMMGLTEAKTWQAELRDVFSRERARAVKRARERRDSARRR